MGITVDGWLEILIVVAGAAIIVFMILKAVGLFLAKGGKIKAGKGGVAVGRGPDDPTPPPHVGCVHSGDIMSVVARTLEFAEYKIDRKSEVIAEQMKFFEEKELEIRGYLQKVFVHILDDHLSEKREIVLHSEYLAYRAVLVAVGRDIRDYIRVAMRQNHFADMEGDRWSEYKERKRIGLYQLCTDLINQYWRGVIVRREDLYAANHGPDVERYMNAAIDEIFENARHEALLVRDDLEDARSRYEAFIKEKVTG